MQRLIQDGAIRRARPARGVDPVGLLAQMGAGCVLDIPAGEGAQSSALQRLGFKVLSADLFRPDRRDRATAWVCADANRELPFADASFDYVLSREGIEHLENQAGFIRECARVLKDGAKIVITTPNVMHLSARLSYFLTGQRALRRGIVNEVQTLRGKSGRRYYHGHVFLIDYFRMRYLLRLSGFDRLQVFTDRYSPTALAMAWAVPALYAASKWSIRSSARTARKKRLPAPPYPVLAEILHHVFSPAALFGKRMIVLARREDRRL